MLYLYLQIGGVLKRITNKRRSGSALLVALVFTGLLVLVSAGVSSLIARESRQIVTLVNGARAYYAAESGIELALLDIQENRQDFETVKKDIDLNSNDTYSTTSEYSLASLTNRLPYLTSEEADALGSPRFPERESYNSLGLNQSITIPLGDDTNFRLDFYWPFGSKLNKIELDQYDVLRWKLFGTNEDNNIDSISEFSPSATPDSSRSGISAEQYACIGTEQGCWTAGAFFPSSLPGQAQAVASGTNITIQEFMRTHKDNYLVISNFIDPGQVNLRGLQVSEEEGAEIRYRIWDLDALNNATGKGSIVNPFTHLRAVGYSGGLSRVLEVDIAPDNFLPIFDFALYRPKLVGN